MDIDCMIQSQRHVDMFFEYYTTGARPIVRGAFSAAAWPTPQASSLNLGGLLLLMKVAGLT